MMVDTNVIVDLRDQDPRWFVWSFGIVRNAGAGNVYASAIVVGELAANSGSPKEVAAMLEGFAIPVQALGADVAYRAGIAQRDYRRAGGTRERLLADFLIGAHAETACMPLLTRDPRRYRTYFPDLPLITPETHPHG